jgi:hypothetical protein
MSGDDFHQILVPYLLAGGATGLILLIAAAFLKRDGARQKDQAKRGHGQTPDQSANHGRPSAKR